MTLSITLPLLVSPRALSPHLDHPDLRLVDLGKASTYAQAHLPGAVWSDIRHWQLGTPPAPGALPPAEALGEQLSALGLTPHTQVVAYDDEGGLRAARFLWVLDAIGHPHYSLLDGGIHAWLAEERPFEVHATRPVPTDYPTPPPHPERWATLDEVLAQHRDPGVVIWDARSPDEFTGQRATGRRAGHIPGAVNYEWSRAIDPQQDLRLRDLETLRRELAEVGIHGEQRLITHCQTHQRSSFTWLLGRILGFSEIRGYPGAWAEWSSRDDTPVA